MTEPEAIELAAGAHPLDIVQDPLEPVAPRCDGCGLPKTIKYGGIRAYPYWMCKSCHARAQRERENQRRAAGVTQTGVSVVATSQTIEGRRATEALREIRLLSMTDRAKREYYAAERRWRREARVKA
jgi:transposase-like protein